MESSVLRAPHFGSEVPIFPRGKLILQHISDPLGDPKPLSTLSATNCPHIHTTIRRGTKGRLHDLRGEICECVWVQVDLQEAPPLEVYRGQFKLSLYFNFRLMLGSSVSFRQDMQMLLFEPTYYFELTFEHLPPRIAMYTDTRGCVGFQNRKKSVGLLFI